MNNFSIEELRELADILREKGLGSLEITSGDYSLRMTAPSFAQPVRTMYSEEQQVPGYAEPAAQTVNVPLEGRIVTSPIVGVFYNSPSPDSDAFVEVGSRVSAGDTLCIVEAMKLMNEITAEFDGEVLEVMAASGDMVDYGRPLFRIKEL